MSAVGGVYVSRRGYQPVCVGLDNNGQLVWEYQMKQPWHQKMFPVPYGGDFHVEWMWKSLQEKGAEWEASNEI